MDGMLNVILSIAILYFKNEKTIYHSTLNAHGLMQKCLFSNWRKCAYKNSKDVETSDIVLSVFNAECQLFDFVTSSLATPSNYSYLTHFLFISAFGFNYIISIVYIW